MIWLKTMATVLTILDSTGTLELYRIHRALETPQQTDERRRRSREYMRTRRARMNSEKQRRINRDYMQRRRASLTTQNCHNKFDLNREPNNAQVNSNSVPTIHNLKHEKYDTYASIHNFTSTLKS